MTHFLSTSQDVHHKGHALLEHALFHRDYTVTTNPAQFAQSYPTARKNALAMTR